MKVCKGARASEGGDDAVADCVGDADTAGMGEERHGEGVVAKLWHLDWIMGVCVRWLDKATKLANYEIWLGSKIDDQQ